MNAGSDSDARKFDSRKKIDFYNLTILTFLAEKQPRSSAEWSKLWQTVMRNSASWKNC